LLATLDAACCDHCASFAFRMDYVAVAGLCGLMDGVVFVSLLVLVTLVNFGTLTPDAAACC